MEKLSEDADCRLLADDSGNGGVVTEKPDKDECSGGNPDVPKGQPDFGHWTLDTVPRVLSGKLETCSGRSSSLQLIIVDLVDLKLIRTISKLSSCCGCLL